MSTLTKPQIVLVPGAGHTPECMGPLMTKLHALGYTTHCQQMASVGNPNPPADLSEDIAILRREVQDAIGPGNDVVVVPHSWGGIVTSDALKGLSKREREAAGQKGGVTRIGYMASFVLAEGVSLVDSSKGKPSRLFAVDDDRVNMHCAAPEQLYNDLPDEEQKRWTAALTTHSFASFAARTTYAAWKHIPSSYLLCQRDLATLPSAQEAMVKAAQDAGADMQVTRIDSGHSPFLSKVDETVAWIQSLAGEKDV